MQEEAKAKEEEGIPDEEGWVKVTRRGRRPVLPRTEAASLRVLERERRKRARKELLNFYAWQHRETKMERKERPGPLCFSPASLGPGPARGHCCQPWLELRDLEGGQTWVRGGGVLGHRLPDRLWSWGSQPAASPVVVPSWLPNGSCGGPWVA